MPGKTSSSALGSSTAVEDYLERILGLINSKGYARVVDIAAALKISQASVTNMVQRLDAEGLLKYEKYRGLILTGAAKKLARQIAHRHKLLTDFLSLLGLDERVIYHDVEGMEHHISPPTVRAIEALTAQLRQRPALPAQLEAVVAVPLALVEKCDCYKASPHVRLTIEPGLQRIDNVIGRQQTVQSSINVCSGCDVSIWIGKISPQCGQVTGVSAINSILR